MIFPGHDGKGQKAGPCAHKPEDEKDGGDDIGIRSGQGKPCCHARIKNKIQADVQKTPGIRGPIQPCKGSVQPVHGPVQQDEHQPQGVIIHPDG